jgi:hypothetical protein
MGGDGTFITGSKKVTALLLSLGQSIGTLSVRGDLILGASSTYFGGTTFNSVVAPPSFVASLTYAPNDIFLDLIPALGLGTTLPGNTANIANVIIRDFINDGRLPAGLAQPFSRPRPNAA